MQLKPQTRFLLRGSILLVGLLAVWWFFLLSPMLVVLEVAGGVLLPIQAPASGDWTLTVALDRIMPATPERPVAQQIHSIDFDMQRSDLVAFTFSLPVFWALMLAAPGLRRNLRPLLLGTAVMAAVELALFLAFAQIAARNSYAQVAGVDDATANWARHLGEYLIVGVLPFILPFAVALSLQRELRGAIFPWGQGVRDQAAETPPAVPPLERQPAKRAKKRQP